MMTDSAAPGAADNSIGDEGAKALASALEPRKNPDGSWAFNGALAELNLKGETCGPFPCCSLLPFCRRSMMTDSAAPGSAVNHIGAEGAKALASALEPRKNLDGTWAFNGALKELNLQGETCSPFPLPLAPPLCLCPFCRRSMMTDSADLALQGTTLEMREPRPSPLPWSPARTLMAPGRSTGRWRR